MLDRADIKARLAAQLTPQRVRDRRISMALLPLWAYAGIALQQTWQMGWRHGLQTYLIGLAIMELMIAPLVFRLRPRVADGFSDVEVDRALSRAFRCPACQAEVLREEAKCPVCGSNAHITAVRPGVILLAIFGSAAAWAIATWAATR